MTRIEFAIRIESAALQVVRRIRNIRNEGATMIRDLIPAPARKVIYTVLAAVAAVELALDAVGWGLVPAETQGKVLVVLSALGFTLAAGNTRTDA